MMNFMHVSAFPMHLCQHASRRRDFESDTNDLIWLELMDGR